MACPCGSAAEHYVWIGFLPYSSAQQGEYAAERWLYNYRFVPTNWWTTVLSGSDYYHCQPFFYERRADRFVTFSVDTNTKRVFRANQKQFSRGWHFLRIRVRPEVESAMWNFLGAQLGKPLNERGAYWLFFWPHSGEGRTWFCSELTTAAFQSAGYLRTAVPECQSPGSLHRLIVDGGEFEGTCDIVSHPLVSHAISSAIRHRSDLQRQSRAGSSEARRELRQTPSLFSFSGAGKASST